MNEVCLFIDSFFHPGVSESLEGKKVSISVRRHLCLVIWDRGTKLHATSWQYVGLWEIFTHTIGALELFLSGVGKRYFFIVSFRFVS
jgi:hypothetical protein